MDVTSADTTERVEAGRIGWPVWTIVGLALAIRLFLAVSSVYIWDEDHEWIVLASTISLDPAALHLPIQGLTHPVLPAYLMRAGTLVAGDTALGFRLFSVLAGALTVLLAACTATRWGGPSAGVATTLLLALNEYHLAISSVAVDMVFYLLFLMLAIMAFARFLEDEAASALVLTGLCTGLGYMCNERAALFVPIWGVSLLLTSKGRWLRRWPTWAALLVFVLVISPDLAKGWLESAERTQTSFSEHLSRLTGIGITYQPAGFFGKDLVRALLGLAGLRFMDWAPEYPAMNELFGATLLLGVLALALSKESRGHPVLRVWLASFCFALVALIFLRTEYNEQKGLGPQAWYWADLLLLPAALATGAAIGRLRGWRSRLLVVLLAGGCLVSGYRIVANRLGLPWVKVGASPTVLTPPDGRMEEVRTGFLTCFRCDPEPEITLEKIEVESGKSLRDPRPGEVEVAEGGDPRRILLKASRDVALYVLRYQVRDDDGREAPLAIDILVREEPSRWRPMFWLEGALPHNPSASLPGKPAGVP